jgi:hypothetical protein
MDSSSRVAYLMTLTAERLKALCLAIGLPTSGSKRILACRIAVRERKA